jgi:hypothetical protein
MLNNLSFRDKVIIFIFTAALIICAFIFAIYRPQTEEIKTLKVQRTKQEKTWLERKKVIDENPDLREDRDALIKESTDTAALFTPLPGGSISNSSMFVNDQIDDIFDRNHIRIDSFNTTQPTPQAIPVYFNAVSTLSYPLLEAGDVSGDIENNFYEDTGYTRQMQGLKSPQVLTTTISISFTGKRPDIFTLISEVALMGKAPAKDITPEKLYGTIRITSLNIADYTFAEGKTELSESEQDVSKGTITIQVYSVDPPTFTAKTTT